MKICIAGKNSIAIYGLQQALALVGPDSVVVCPNRNDDGQSNWQPSLRRYAHEFGVPAITLDDLYSEQNILFLSLEFDQIIKPERFASSRLFNIHFSLLPAYKGVYTSAWPILNGEEKSGVTLHRIDHGIDTGELIYQSPIQITEQETARSLYFKYLDCAKDVLDQNFGTLVSDSVHSYPQPPQRSTYYSKASIDYRALRIDTNQTADAVCRQIRAYSFREFQTPVLYDMPIGRCRIMTDRSQAKPGTVLSRDDDSLVLATIDYNIFLERDRSLDLFGLVELVDTEGIISNAASLAMYVNVTNCNGWTPLMIAAYKGLTDVCKALIEVGADPNMPNQNGTTPLMYAKEYCELANDFTICDILIEAGADPDQGDNFGKTILHYATQKQQHHAITYFGG